jgi:hypothetical protein
MQNLVSGTIGQDGGISFEADRGLTYQEAVGPIHQEGGGASQAVNSKKGLKMTAQKAFARFCYSDLRPISDVDIQLTIVGFGTTIVPLRSVDLPPRDPRHRLIKLIEEILSVHV